METTRYNSVNPGKTRSNQVKLGKTWKQLGKTWKLGKTRSNQVKLGKTWKQLGTTRYIPVKPDQTS